MLHDPTLAVPTRADARPPSAVGAGVGFAGLAGLAIWIAAAIGWGMDGPYAALVGLLACGLPMVGWSLVVDKVHCNPGTGIDWSAARTAAEMRDVSLTKLAGLYATWCGIACVYGIGRFYWDGNFAFAMWCFGWGMPVVAVLAVPYVLWLDRYLVEPRDGAWHVGDWLTGQAGVDIAAIQGHLRAWAVKAFFLAFMLAVVPGNFAGFVHTDPTTLRDPVALAQWLIALMFVIDVAFATVGYMLTLRPLDAHIRSANPFAAAWTAALMCYPPFILMDAGGPLDYHPGTQDWTVWFAGHPLLLGVWGTMLVGLTAIYAAATVAFALLEPHQPGDPDPWPLCLVAPSRLSVEEPVLVAVDAARAHHREHRRCGARDRADGGGQRRLLLARPDRGTAPGAGSRLSSL